MARCQTRRDRHRRPLVAGLAMRPLLALLLALHSAGCHILLPFPIEQTTDGRSADIGAVERQIPDGATADTAAVHDRLRDHPASDRRADSIASDSPLGDLVAHDSAPHDLATTDLPPPPCSSGSTVAFAFAPTMVVCTSLAGSAQDQCAAEQLCNVAHGWHLCTAGEFLARGGQTLAYAPNAWLAACTTYSSSASAFGVPTDGVCGCSTPGSIAPNKVAWNCGTTLWATQSSYTPLGVVATDACTCIGPATASCTDGYWKARLAQEQHDATCCR